MGGSELFLLCLRVPQVGSLALSDRPAWVWTADGSRLVWANAAGAATLGARTTAAVLEGLDSQHPAAREVARLVSVLSPSGHAQLSRLRGFLPGLGGTLLCACSRLRLPDGRGGILTAGMQPARPALAFEERVRGLFAGLGDVAVFSPAGALLYASPHAAAEIAGIAHPDVAAPRLSRHVELEKIGEGAGAVLLARLEGPEAEIAAPWPAPAAAEAHPSPRLASSAVPEPSAPALAEGSPPLEPCAGAENGLPVAETGPEPAHARDAGASAQPAPETLGPEEKGEAQAADGAERESVETPAEGAAPSSPDEAEPEPEAARTPQRRHPLRFVWQMDAAGRFTIQSDEFVSLVGQPTVDLLGRPWNEIAAALGLDPDGKVAQALASHDTWSGLTVDWPAQGVGAPLPVSLSGLPVLQRERAFCGYRGFGVCRATDRIAEAILARRDGARLPPGESRPPEPRLDLPAPEDERAAGSSTETEAPGTLVRPEAPSQAGETTPPPRPVSPLFAGEIASAAAGIRAEVTFHQGSPNVVPFPHAAPTDKRPGALSPGERTAFQEIARALGARLEPAEGARGRGGSGADEERPGNASAAPPQDRAEAEPPRVQPAVTADHAIGAERRDAEVEAAEPAVSPAIPPAAEQAPPEPARNGSAAENIVPPPAVAMTPETATPAGELSASELHAILDTATDGVLVLDEGGRVLAANRSAEALFGYDAAELTGLPLAELFAPESQGSALDYLEGLTQSGVASLLNDGREVIGRVREGGLIPLFMTMGRLGAESGKFCAVFRDITQWKRAEEELTSAKREAERASLAKSDFLAKAGDELRTPLDSILGFADAIRERRFGPVGNERYRQCAEDIHRAGKQTLSLLDDLLDLSKIEAGRLDLSFAKVDLNEVMQQCVASMQPHANRERIIIRTSLSSSVPPVVADARSIRQIVLNLLSNSIKFTGAGGQVIVSTALTEGGEAVLRVRDTGIGMSEGDVAAALEPFRQLAASSRNPQGSGLGLPLTKALAEANRASFSIRSNLDAGTMVEVAFPPTRVLAE